MEIDRASLTGNWNYPTRIRFGPGRIVELPEACREVGIRHPLLVTDPGLAQLPVVEHIVRRNGAAGLPTGLFRDVQPNPVGRNVTKGVEAYNNSGHDGVIAFGGGSALDVAKAIAFMVGQTRPMWDFEDREDWWTRAETEGIAKIVAVPTTSGTGSEVGRASVITDEQTRTKKILFHPLMLPAQVIADPELTIGLPAKLTAAVGMDALSHNLEAYCAKGYHPLADGIALQGMALVRRWLKAAVKDGADLAARSHMMAASSMGATAFQKGLGAMHALSHPCSALFGTHHGMTNGVLMPYVLAFNRSAIEEKLTALARYLDLPSPSGQAVIDWVLKLRQAIGIPHTLADIGISADSIEKLVPYAVEDPAGGGNPMPLSATILAELYRDAIEGRIEAGER